ncbi:cell division protein ZipA [Acinetobacter sp. ME22]|uniref:cell division protein ZipA C-terminal FtsZ-binding domain-containing protein n=1 Tax=Acinetobacter sp. ME22 TaxID=2904802 RepID=UPI001EDB3DAE|nr:cell division protein ZipA C-terminal FtsZ-binding domain-containing protein [Acinetobacter sp. ME22]MCG2574245.1 cell division protein ZipA [Acinetobacter sp. ME22]
MEITTIVGIVIAVAIILLGLFLMFRKPKEYVPSLESELHINPETNQPVIPRFVRDQLSKAQALEQRVEPHLDEDDKTEAVAEAEPVIEKKTEDTAQNVAAEKVVVSEAVVQKSKQPEVETVKETAAVEAEEAKKEEEIALSLNPDVETVEIADFEEESSILDMHLHEQQRYDDESALSNAEYIFALNVYPNPRRVLSGDRALKVLLKYGLRFGELSCFHRYENTEEESPLMFSVLRVTDEGPAGFDLETLSAEQVQGFAFFLALPNPNAQTGFDMMVSIANLIARDIDGKVFDENNCELTQQLKEHWRHQIIDYKPQAAQSN